jgi:hypothetical protein
MKMQDYYGTRQSAWRRALAHIAATGAVVALAACQTHVAHERPTGTVLGRVNANGSAAPVMVLALDRGTGKIVHRAFLGKRTAFSMPLTAGSYKFYACADADLDGVCGSAEPRSVLYSLSKPVMPGEIIQMPTFRLARPQTVAAAR